MENCVLVDWLTFSSQFDTVESIINLLGLRDCKWVVGKASRLHYAHVLQVDGISVHYTNAEETSDKKYNTGVCVEMSGCGCRFFETFSDFGFVELFRHIAAGSKAGYMNASRLDLAYDDFSGLIDIECMKYFTEKDWYTCVMQTVSIQKSREKKDSGLWGLNIYHGSRGSNVSFRCYDKRVERKQYDIPHWIRFEMQLRHDGALGFIQKLFLGEDFPDIGFHFAGIIRRYLEYKCPGEDSNVSRWKIAPWWLRFVGDVEKFSTIMPKDTEYNKERMDRYAYKQNHNHTLTEIEIDGAGRYLLGLHSFSDDLPDKYKKVASAAANSDEILRRLGELKQEDGLSYLRRCAADIQQTIERVELAEDLAVIFREYQESKI